MKKNLLSCAVTGALLCGSLGAHAADVEVYGIVDTGLVYERLTGTLLPQSNTFSMESGVNSGSRFGLRGSEDLGNGFAVSFRLENGFGSDDGTLKQSSDDTTRLFGREARVTLETPYGSVSFGRMGALTSGCGTFDIFQAEADVMDGGYANHIGTQVWFERDRYDNLVTLESPVFAGVKLYAQYSFATDGQEQAGNERKQDRYAALGATWTVGDLSLVGVVDSVLYEHDAEDYIIKRRDAVAVSVGANYALDPVTVFAGAQWGRFNKSSHIGIVDASDDSFMIVDGWNFAAGARFDLPCGSLETSVFYDDLKGSYSPVMKLEKWGVGVMHSYPLSKRTVVYTGVGYQQHRFENTPAYVYRMKAIDATVGLKHSF
ncbi:porin [Sutterella sp.]|uniref:porin n=1 Tax=Sutterella sp. TaxID=1981025 RepID=UPI0026DEA384|nr:porin [Sutterella sp.]MDO5532512.1 porin [Sutterella sp.]